MIRRVVSNYTIELLKIVLLLLATVHYLSSFWLLVARVEALDSADHWTEAWMAGLASEFEMYLDSCFWATEALTGVMLSGSISFTVAETAVCIPIMVLGAFTYAFIFGRLVAILEQENSQQELNRDKLEMVMVWSKHRKLPADLSMRLEIYYKMAEVKFSTHVDYRFIDELPLSLKTEVSLFIFRDLLSKVKLFEIGDPAFMMAMIRYLKPRLYMMGDFIIHQGDYPTEFYIVRNGLVEVLATDGATQIALLDQGSYFGEIGILLNIYRTLSVKAYEACVICYIPKDNLMQVLRSFPGHLKVLTEVATQRMQCMHPQDIDTGFDLMEDSSSDDSDHSEDLTPPNFFTEKEHHRKTWIKKFLTVPNSNAPRDRIIIDPFSRFYYTWAAVIVVTYIYMMCYIPFAIAFEDRGNIPFFVLGVLAYLVYFLDIVVNLYTAIITEFGTYSHSWELIKKLYLREYFLLDLLSMLPADFVCYFLNAPYLLTAYLRVFRLLKVRRVVHLLKAMIKNPSQQISKIRLVIIISLLVYLSHLVACIFFYISKIDYYNFPNSRFDHTNFILQYNNFSSNCTDLLQDTLLSQYISMLYIGAGILSTGSYGDVYPTAAAEKLFAIFCLLVARFLVALLYAETSTLFGNFNRAYIRHINKVNLLKQWIDTNQLPKSLRSRILNYYDLLWRKLNGSNDDEVLNDIPEALRTDISNYLFSGLTTSGLFPSDESGALLCIVRRCKVEVYCAGETIINEGEIGLEMYFVMEGVVKVRTKMNVELNRLHKGSFFGEIAVIKPTPDVRLASVIAENNVALAVLSLKDYREISGMFPEFAENVLKQAAERENMNRSTFQNENLATIKEYHRLIKQFENGNVDIIETEAMKSEVYDNLVEVPSNKFLSGVDSSRWKNVVYASVWLWNFMFIPYKIAFGREFDSVTLLFESITIVVYLCFSLYYFKIATILSSNPSTFPGYSRNSCLVNGFYHVLLAFPILLIGESYSMSPTVASVFSLIRISNFFKLFPFFSRLKQRIDWFTTLSVLEIFSIYIFSSHIFGCYYIIIGKTYDPNHSWLTPYLDLPDSSLYIYAFYWADATLSHTSVGDVFSKNPGEKLYNTIVFILGCFIYGMLFGYISSLVSGFASQLKTNLHESYLYVKHFVKKKKVEKVFSKLIDDYYNHLWHTTKGIAEETLLKELPHSIMCDIQIFLYARSISLSQVFRNSNGSVDYSVTQSIFRVISIQCYLVGDTIIKVGDKNSDMYIILEGEVDVVNIQGKQVLASLGEGAHFGEANVILKSEMRTATVIATKISKIGVLDKSNLEMLFEAYPHWYEKLESIVRQRMQKTFNSSDSHDIMKQCKEISSKLQEPGSYNKYTKRSEKLMAPKIAEIIAKTSTGKWITLNIVHFTLIIYSAFAIPMVLGFGLDLSEALIMMESIVIVESLVYLILSCKESTSQLIGKKVTLWRVLKHYYHQYIFIDLISISPFNLIFGLVNPFNYWLYLLRLVRVLSLFRAQSVFEKFEMYNRNLLGVIKAMRILLVISMVMHWSCCIWGFVTRLETNGEWIQSFDFAEQSFGIKYEYCLFYVLNLISGTGYSNTSPATDVERVFSVLYSIVGFVLFSVSFGLMASISKLKTTDLQEMINNIRSPFNIIDKKDIPVNLITKIEQYYAFTTGLTQTIGPINFKSLYLHLPPRFVGTIIYECSRGLLKKVPFLAQLKSIEIIERISLYLVPQIYLPGDYIIYKNDVGEEMFFIILGSVNILGPDNHKIVKSLKKGDFFGEVALLTDARRMCSVVSNGLSLIYSLSKSDFLNLLMDFPDVSKIIEAEAMKRESETRFIRKNHIREESQAEMQEDLVQTIQMYSSMSSPFFDKGSSPRRITLLSGMKHYTAEVIKESYRNISNHSFHKRRPPVFSIQDRRLSQEALGKQLVLSRFSNLRKI